MAAEGLFVGSWGGSHWQLRVTDGGNGTIEGDCSIGTFSVLNEMPYTQGTGTYVNLSISLALQFDKTTPTKYTTVTVSDGLVATDNVTLTGTMISGTYSEKFKGVKLATADLFKCVSSGMSVQVRWLAGAMALLVALILQ